jgi:uncharacterized phage protein (TIGR01671 family)
MTRETKFRAWDKHREEMWFEFEKKVVAEDQTEYAFSAFHFPSPFMSGIFSLADVMGEPRRFEVMQFTGLTDKAGKEIWEGDILKSCYNGFHSVAFANGAFRIEHTKECCKPWRGGLLSEVDNTDVVVGNIYENPDKLDPSYPSFH